jgi:hypothetical protein
VWHLYYHQPDNLHYPMNIRHLPRTFFMLLASLPLLFASCSAPDAKPAANSRFGPERPAMSPVSSLNKGIPIAQPVAKDAPAPISPSLKKKMALYDRSTLHKRVIAGKTVDLPTRMRDGKPFETEVKVNGKLVTYSINQVNWPQWTRNRWQRNIECQNMAKMVPDDAFLQVAEKIAAENAMRPEIAETRAEREFIDIGISWGDLDGDIQRFGAHQSRALAGQTLTPKVQ